MCGIFEWVVNFPDRDIKWKDPTTVNGTFFQFPSPNLYEMAKWSANLGIEPYTQGFTVG